MEGNDHKTHEDVDHEECKDNDVDEVEEEEQNDAPAQGVTDWYGTPDDTGDTPGEAGGGADESIGDVQMNPVRVVSIYVGQRGLREVIIADTGN